MITQMSLTRSLSGGNVQTTVGESARRFIIAQARLAVTDEQRCGFLLGKDASKIEASLAAPNSYLGDRRKRFAISPEDYVEAEIYAGQYGFAIIGIYHTRVLPDDLRPSLLDLEYALPEYIYLIAEPTGSMKIWRIYSDKTGYEEVFIK